MRLSRWSRIAGGALLPGVVVVTGTCAPRRPRDPLVGVWQLNLSRTHYSATADPRREETFTCAPAGEAVRCTIRSVRANGETIVGGFTARYDGAASPVHGIPDVDEIRLRRAGERRVAATFSYRGRPVFGYLAARSTGGESLTIVSVDPVTGSRLESTVVYDRVGLIPLHLREPCGSARSIRRHSRGVAT